MEICKQRFTYERCAEHESAGRIIIRSKASDAWDTLRRKGADASAGDGLRWGGCDRDTCEQNGGVARMH